MKRILLLSFTSLFMWANNSQAQRLSPAELNGGGGSGSNAAVNISLNYSLGNAYGTSTVALSISLNTTPGRQATETDLAELPAEMKEEILKTKAGLNAWPVPSEGPVQLKTEGLEDPVLVRIFDQKGSLVQELSLDPQAPTEIVLPNPGIFFVRTNHPEIPTLRLVKQ
jgi:hypothetical protein